MTKEQAVKGQYMVDLNGGSMKQRLLKDWDAEDDEEARENLEHMTPKELFEAWMNYEGIIGYADTIIRALRESGFIVEAVE